MGTGDPLRIASRGSELALIQSRWVASVLEERLGVRPVIEIVRTTGDRITDVPLARIGNRGLFTKELDEAVRTGRADFAVHSMKDVPTTFPIELELVAIGQREDPRDVLVFPYDHAGEGLAQLRPGARVGTSALRRRSQLHELRPDLEAVDVRGNLDTRLRKLESEEYDALILAAAGLRRSGRGDRTGAPLAVDQWTPAVGQGTLGAVCRAGDDRTRGALGLLEDTDTVIATLAERAMLRHLEGGCQVPIGAHARIVPDGTLVLDGFVGSLDGKNVIRRRLEGESAAAEELGVALARQLIADGAADILEAVREEFEASSR